MQRFLVLVFFGFPLCLVAQIDGAQLFDDSFLHELRFTSVDTSFYLDTKDYQSVDVEIDGVSAAAVGLKRKGNLSGYPETNKFPIKVKMNKYVQGQEYDGIKEFTLHMNYEDPTMLREKLTYEICAEMGLYSLRTAFAKVYLDDVYWGLYTLVEAKDEMYKQVFDNRDADAMESTDFGDMCYKGSEIDDYFLDEFGSGIYFYEQDNGDYDTSWSRFIEMLDIVNNTPSDENYVTVADQYLNLRDFFAYQAVNVFLVNHDSYLTFTGNQRYVYDEAESRWQVTPWDFNASFGLWNTNNVTVTDYPLFPGFSCFGDKVNEVAELRTFYLDAMCMLTTEVADTTRLYNRIDELAAQIETAVAEDYRKVVTQQEFERGLEFGYNMLFAEDQPALKTVVRERNRLISESLEALDYDCGTTTTARPESAAAAVALYPNPVTDQLFFSGADVPATAFSARITDLAGRSVHVAEVVGGTLRLPLLPAGVYYCTLELPTGRVVRRFIRQ